MSEIRPNHDSDPQSKPPPGNPAIAPNVPGPPPEDVVTVPNGRAPEKPSPPQTAPQSDVAGTDPNAVEGERLTASEQSLSGVSPRELSGLLEEIRALREVLDATQARVIGLESRLENIDKRLGFLPPQVRSLGEKVDGLSTAITEPRYRTVLHSLLGIYDLVDQVLRSTSAPIQTDHLRNYEVLRTQLRQVLEGNGLIEIPADGAFDPELHKAVESVDCTDPAKADHVRLVVRPGFRTSRSILRYAEVSVWRRALGAPEQPEESEINGG